MTVSALVCFPHVLILKDKKNALRRATECIMTISSLIDPALVSDSSGVAGRIGYDFQAHVAAALNILCLLTLV